MSRRAVEARQNEGSRQSGLAEAASRLGPWFHNLHLPDGTETAPDHPYGDFPRTKWRQVADFLPQDLRDSRVLDVGCNAGFYAIELARRGASVTAIDVDPHYLRQAQWAARVFGVDERITFEQRQVYSLVREERRFDLVLFMGVFYHLRYPMLALDILAMLAPPQLVFQSLTTSDQAEYKAPDHLLDLDQRDRLDRPGWPKLAFVEGSLCADPTNWWVPNVAGVHALLRAAGFRIVATPGHEIFLCERDPAFAVDRTVREQTLAAVGAAATDDLEPSRLR